MYAYIYVYTTSIHMYIYIYIHIYTTTYIRIFGPAFGRPRFCLDFDWFAFDVTVVDMTITSF